MMTENEFNRSPAERFLISIPARVTSVSLWPRRNWIGVEESFNVCFYGYIWQMKRGLNWRETVRMQDTTSFHSPLSVEPSPQFLQQETRGRNKQRSLHSMPTVFHSCVISEFNALFKTGLCQAWKCFTPNVQHSISDCLVYWPSAQDVCLHSDGCSGMEYRTLF